MSATTSCQADLRELSYRESDGIQVSLLWSRADDELIVVVTDTRTGEAFELSASRANALDVFEHPYAYAASAELRAAA